MEQDPRWTGMTFVLMDSDIENDERIEALRLVAPEVHAKAFHVYMLLVCRCWKRGKRLTVRQAWPDLVYPRDVLPSIEAALVQVGLLDINGRIPKETWWKWFVPSWTRREKQILGGIRSAQKRWGTLPGDGPPEAPRTPAKEVEQADAQLTPEQRKQADEAKKALRAFAEKVKDVP